jgi:hypothetical protein
VERGILEKRESEEHWNSFNGCKEKNKKRTEKRKRSI